MRALKLARLVPLFAILLVGLATSACDTTVQADYGVAYGARDLSLASPEDVGMSSERLDRLSSAMQSLVDDGELAGIPAEATGPYPCALPSLPRIPD